MRFYEAGELEDRFVYVPGSPPAHLRPERATSSSSSSATSASVLLQRYASSSPTRLSARRIAAAYSSRTSPAAVALRASIPPTAAARRSSPLEFTSRGRRSRVQQQPARSLPESYALALVELSRLRDANAELYALGAAAQAEVAAAATNATFIAQVARQVSPRGHGVQLEEMRSVHRRAQADEQERFGATHAALIAKHDAAVKRLHAAKSAQVAEHASALELAHLSHAGIVAELHAQIAAHAASLETHRSAVGQGGEAAEHLHAATVQELRAEIAKHADELASVRSAQDEREEDLDYLQLALDQQQEALDLKEREVDAAINARRRWGGVRVKIRDGL